MTTTLVAPERISRRSAVAAILDGLPESVGVLRLIISGDPTTTSSFFDELMKRVLVDARAEHLMIETLDEFIIEQATEAATALGVSARLGFT
jgi:hypothetical protein